MAGQPDAKDPCAGAVTEKDKPDESEISLVAPTAENGKDGAEDEGGESEIAEEDQEIGDALADSQIPDVW